MNIQETQGIYPGLYVEKLHFRNGMDLALNPDDIVVFVGPNNAGKTQCLKDIDNIIGNTLSEPIVLADVDMVLKQSDDNMGWLRKFSKRKKSDNSEIYHGIGYSVYNYHIQDNKFSSNYLYEYRTLFIKQLTTKERLTIVDPPEILDMDEPATHPIHNVKANDDLLGILNESFHKVFGEYVTPDFDSRRIALHVGDIIKLEGDFESEAERLNEFKRRLHALPALQDQGDGMVSLTGIILYLLMPNYSMFLIDEPESFLHPPQAKILGEVISNLTKDKQLFLSTHSQDFLKGLIEKGGKRVKIVRVTRSGNENITKLLSNDNVNAIWHDTLLRHSNIIDSVFHESVCVCESDSDCALYSIILNDLKERAGKPFSTLFTHVGGKARFHKIIPYLKLLGVDYRIIPDLDVLNDRNTIKTLYKSCGQDWQIIKDAYDLLDKEVKAMVPYPPKSLKELQSEVDKIFEEVIASGENELSKNNIINIRATIAPPKGWQKLKKEGISALPSEESKHAIAEIDAALKDEKIYMVPVGELENFFKDISGHGPNWALNVLENHPDLSDHCYDGIRNFIASLGL